MKRVTLVSAMVIILAMALAVVLVLAAAPGTASADGPATLTVTPSRGLPGTSITISGEGFPPYCAISISMGGYSLLLQPLSSATGSFSATYTVPGLDPGVVTVAATGGGSTATTFFTISRIIYVDSSARV